MALNPSIILSGVQPDFLGTIDRGNRAAAFETQMGKQNALTQLYREQGPQIAAGDKQAVNALARLDAPGALDINQTFRDNRMQESEISRRNEVQDRDFDLRVKEYKRTVGVEKAKAEAQRIENGVARATQLYQSGDLQGVNALLESVGEPPLSSLEEFPAVASLYARAADALKTHSDLTEKPAPLSGAGKLADDLANGRITQEQYNTATTKAPLVDFSGAKFGPEGPGVTDKFYEKIDQGQADLFMGLLNEGVNVPAKLAQVDELETLLSNSPSGFQAAAQAYLGRYGVNTEGLSSLQAAEAIISRLVPAQRPPGSGTMSDADLALFKASLPQLINTPEGNKQIIQAIRGIAAYQQKQSEIADKVVSRELTPAEGRKQLMALENPLRVERRDGATTIGGGYTIREVK